MGNNGSTEEPLDVEKIYEEYNIKLESDGKIVLPNKLEIIFETGGCCGGTSCDSGSSIPLHYVEKEPKVQIPYYGMTKGQRLNNQFRQFSNGQFTLIMLSDEGSDEHMGDPMEALQSKIKKLDEKLKDAQSGKKGSNNLAWLHWLVVNIPQGSKVSKGDQCVKYKRPSPPKGSGFNKYVVFVFEQVASIPPVPIRQRQNFCISSFAQRLSLWLPVAVNYFHCKKWTTKSQLQRINRAKGMRTKFNTS